MREVVIVEAVRSPLGKRNGGLSAMHSIDLLGAVQAELFNRSGVDPSLVGQVVGGCVGQVGMQTMNVTRNAWLTAGLPIEVAATTVDAQCGSSQQATNLAYALVASGVVDAAVGCGVEVMSRVPMGSTTPKEPNVGKPVNKSYWKHHELTSQFDGAERIAKQWGTHPRGHRRLRQVRRKSAPPRPGTSTASIRRSSPIDAPDWTDDGKPARRRTASIATRDCARRPWRPWPGSAPTCPTVSTPPAPRRRSPTVPAPCC